MTFFKQENYPTQYPEHKYNELEELVKETLELNAKEGLMLLSTVPNENSAKLPEIYINNIPAAKDHYTCNSCFNFIRLYGGLVVVTKDFETKSAVWDESDVPDFFKPAVKALRKEVESRNIDKRWYNNTAKLGTMPSKTSEWTHLHAVVPNSYKVRDLDVEFQKSSKEREAVKTVLRLMAKLDDNSLTTVKALIDTEGVYRAYSYKDNINTLIKYFDVYEDMGKDKFKLYLYTNPTLSSKLAVINGSLFMELVTTISEGVPTNIAVVMFNEKADPANYQRSKTGPSATEVKLANDLIVELGLEDSFKRSYLTKDKIDPLAYLWVSEGTNGTVKKKESTPGLFDNIPTRDKSKPKVQVDSSLPKQVMTLSKFMRTILPNATKLSARKDYQRLSALVGPVNDTDKPVTKWSNNITWFYADGNADVSKFSERVNREGGKYSGNFMRASLIWECRDDLDISLMKPDGEVIYYGNKRGILDVDMNVNGESLEPVENLRMAKSQMKKGKYKVRVHNYTKRTSCTPYELELDLDGRIIHIKVEDANVYGNEKPVIVSFEFDGHNINNVNIKNSSDVTVLSDSTSTNASNYKEIYGIINSPNLWENNETKVDGPGEHIFFLFKGDTEVEQESLKAKEKMFFNEFLINELHPIRKTIEVFTNMNAIETVDEPVIGLGYNNTSTIDESWDLDLLVETKDGITHNIIIDRLD